MSTAILPADVLLVLVAASLIVGAFPANSTETSVLALIAATGLATMVLVG